jgi:hypothetical protein
MRSSEKFGEVEKPVVRAAGQVDHPITASAQPDGIRWRREQNPAADSKPGQGL